MAQNRAVAAQPGLDQVGQCLFTNIFGLTHRQVEPAQVGTAPMQRRHRPTIGAKGGHASAGLQALNSGIGDRCFAIEHQGQGQAGHVQ
ncbi:hypothetical protein D3C85_1494530 [compost metagenome]